MKTNSKPVMLVRVAMLAATLLAGAPGGIAQAADTAATTAPDQGRSVLDRMGKFLAGTKQFSVAVASSYEAVQDSGARIEFNAERKVTVARPDRIRIEHRDGDAPAEVFTFDGKTLTLSQPTGGVYAQAERAGDIDSALRYFIQDLRMRLPLAILLVSNLPEELDRRVTSVDYVGKTRIAGVPVHHVAGSTDAVDFQVWIKDGAEPVPVRIVITYVEAEGQPKFRADLSGWNLAPATNPAMFAFTPAKDARKIAFAGQVKVAAQGGKEEGK